MHFKALPILLLSTAAIATANEKVKVKVQENKRDIDIGDKIDDIIDDVISDAVDFGKSITSLFPEATAIPGSIWDSITDASLVTEFHSSLHSALEDNKTPDWYSDLPKDAQSYFDSAYAQITGAAATITGDIPLPTGDDDDDDDNDNDDDDDDNSAQESENAAPRPTGALMASVAGAAGILGLAIAL